MKTKQKIALLRTTQKHIPAQLMMRFSPGGNIIVDGNNLGGATTRQMRRLMQGKTKRGATFVNGRN